MGRSALLLGLLTVAVGYAVITHGGDVPADSYRSLLLVGLTAIVGGLTIFRIKLFSRPERTLDVAIFAFPVYVALQLVPLPLALLHVVSPVRAEVTEALGGIMALPRFAPLTISPATTWVYLSRIVGYVLVFLVVRQIARRSTFSAWAPAVPLIVIGVLEAAWALASPPVEGTPFAGTYQSRDHFAGLLEMILPFALAYGFALLSRGRLRSSVPGAAIISAFVLFAAAVAMFVAITLSVSKMGLFSSLGSLFVMGILGMQWKPSRGPRWPVVAGLVVLGLCAILFLTPTEFVEQFGAVLSDRTTEGRLPIAKDTLRLFAAYPIFGCGLGAFYPGLTRYQIAGSGVAWVNAHNDYLQLLSELGVIGFIIPAVLVWTVFTRSVRTALSRSASETWEPGSVDHRERRFLGLGCAGGLTAILIHSGGDYNTYVLANAMVLAWIMGIAASLPPVKKVRTQHASLSAALISSVPSVLGRGATRDPHGLPLPLASWSSRASLPGWPLVLALGGVLSLYAGGWLVFLNSFHDDLSVEQKFCRFGICDTDAALAIVQGDRSRRSDETVKTVRFLEYLARDPASPSRWDDVGESMQKTGRTSEARYSFDRSVALGPYSAATLLMAADFHFDVGEEPAAFDFLSRTLQVWSDDIARAVAIDLEFRKIPVGEALRAVSPDRRFSRVYWEELRSAETDAPEKTATLWEWMVPRGYADDQLACQHTNFLLAANRPGLAWQSWAVYAGERSKGYPDTNRIFNGDFESDPTGCRFDWTIQPTGGATIEFDRSVAYSGGRSLRVQFDGTANPSEVGVGEEVGLEPGRYRLSGYIRTKELSTDEGVFLGVVNADKRAPINAVTEKLRGTNDWTLVETVFDAPPEGGLVRVFLTRKPSLKFDGLVGGTVWLDQISIGAEGSVTPPHS